MNRWHALAFVGVSSLIAVHFFGVSGKSGLFQMLGATYALLAHWISNRGAE